MGPAGAGPVLVTRSGSGSAGSGRGTPVPPVLAVGLYFCLWHSTRHIARLALLDRTAAARLEAGRLVPVGLRFARDAAPLTAAALLLLVGLYFAVPGSVEGPGSLLALYLVLVSSLTLPHAVVVSYMGLRQGLWRRAKARFDS